MPLFAFCTSRMSARKDAGFLSPPIHLPRLYKIRYFLTDREETDSVNVCSDQHKSRSRSETPTHYGYTVYD
jgi:hypothetical protein